MNCASAREVLPDAALGAAPPAALGDHLAGCPGCAEELARLHRLATRIESELKDALAVAPSLALLPRVRARIAAEAETRRAGLRAWLAPAAATLAALATVALLRPEPPPWSAAGVGGPQGSDRRAAAAGDAAGPPRSAEAPPAALPQAPPARPVGSGLSRAPAPGGGRGTRRRPEVVLAPGEGAALAALARALGTGRIDAAVLGRAAPAEPFENLAIAALALPPLSVEP